MTMLAAGRHERVENGVDVMGVVGDDHAGIHLAREQRRRNTSLRERLDTRTHREHRFAMTRPVFHELQRASAPSVMSSAIRLAAMRPSPGRSVNESARANLLS
jgi:hypothetical protein